MDNEAITITLTVAQWNIVMAILGNAPYIHSAGVIGLIQDQSKPQTDALAAKYAIDEISDATDTPASS